jgi:2-oxoglutarate ferredoxin oxidoreductase subunit alpha
MPTRTQQSDLLACAYASHGDTKHPLLFPCDPRECFEMTAEAFDLAERLQTPVMVMSDLDLGMNDHFGPPLAWDAARRYDRGKVLDGDQLEQLTVPWGRYLDTDGDAIASRTLPGSHPERGVYFTRGTSHDEYSAYTEDSGVYLRNMERLARKWQTARTLVPQPSIRTGRPCSRLGAIFFGTTAPSAYEALQVLQQHGLTIDSLRLRAFPFQPEVFDFVNERDLVFVIEQNRDGQMRTLLINEGDLAPQVLVSITSYDGLPVASRFLVQALGTALAKRGVAVPPAAFGQGEKR